MQHYTDISDGIAKYSAGLYLDISTTRAMSTLRLAAITSTSFGGDAYTTDAVVVLTTGLTATGSRVWTWRSSA